MAISIGLVGRDNDKGLGLLTEEYRKRLNVTKVLVKDWPPWSVILLIH